MTTRRLVLAFATTMRMVDRVHYSTANAGADALPAVTASLADLDVAVLGVANFANGCAAGYENATHFGRRHTQDCILAFLAHQLNAGASGTSDCCTATRLKLNCVDERTNGDCGQGQCIAGLDVCISAGYYRFANLEALRLKDVTLFTVCIVQKSDASTAIGVVLDRGNLGGDTVLVALEVDDAVTTLVAATLMTRSDTAIVVAASLLGQGANRDFSGVVLVISAKSETVWKRRPGLVGLNCFTPIFFLSTGTNCGFEPLVLCGLHHRHGGLWETALGDSEFPRVRVYPSTARRNQKVY